MGQNWIAVDIIPFKFRSGDIFSDTTIGPYVAYKFQRMEYLASLGIAQISIAEAGNNEIESKTGVTFALGINFEVHKDWDIALLAGVDHLSGSAGDSWRYQDKIWLSFGIGYNITRKN